MDNTRDYARVSHSRQWSNYNVLTRGTILPNFILIRFEPTEFQAFLTCVAPTRTTRVAILDQCLMQKDTFVKHFLSTAALQMKVNAGLTIIGFYVSVHFGLCTYLLCKRRNVAVLGKCQ